MSRLIPPTFGPCAKHKTSPHDPKRGDPVAGPDGGDLQSNNPKKVGINQKLAVTFNALGAVDAPASIKFAEGTFELIVHSTGFIEARP